MDEALAEIIERDETVESKVLAIESLIESRLFDDQVVFLGYSIFWMSHSQSLHYAFRQGLEAMWHRVLTGGRDGEFSTGSGEVVSESRVDRGDEPASGGAGL